MTSLMRELARTHEVTQVSLPWYERPSLREHVVEEAVAPGYRHFRYHHPLAWASGEVARRSWHAAPVASGAALRLSRPRALRKLLREADVAIVEYPWSFGWCRSVRSGPLVLATHNFETAKFASWADAVNAQPRRRRRWLRYIERAERAAARSADLVVAVSEDDRWEFMHRFALPAGRVITVPNASDTDAMRPVDGHGRSAARRALGLADRPTAIYLAGLMPANIAGLEWVRRLARSAPEVQFLVVGGVAPAGREGNLLATGVVPDIAPYAHAADLSLCPIAHGGGTKIKLIDALAFGLPSLCFAESSKGLGVTEGVHVLHAGQTGDALLAGLRRLTADAALRARMGRAARELAERRYSWTRVAQPLERALTALARQ